MFNKEPYKKGVSICISYMDLPRGKIEVTLRLTVT